MPYMACGLAADSVFSPMTACLQLDRQLLSQATETALHRSCGPEAWSRCMPSIESIGHRGQGAGMSKIAWSPSWTRAPGRTRLKTGVST